MFLGGAISGFFGGFSGYQGALRSFFLIDAHLSKQGFIGTNAVIAVVVDIVRLVIYGLSFRSLLTSANMPLLVIVIMAAVGGIFLGMHLLKKMTLDFMQQLIIVLLYTFGILLVLGVI